MINYGLDGEKLDEKLVKKFYITSETLLSIFYLHHRISENIDFFVKKNFQSFL
ncbi:MAG: hypothetical protein NZ928_05040 [Endomicrobia bacterium]|nr:hypothetical protein [Endomicrobiia bacterium]